MRNLLKHQVVESKVPPYHLHPTSSRFRKDVSRSDHSFAFLIFLISYLNTHTAKRAVTRQCPVCEEAIPVRLLGAHLDLELHRVDEILKTAGSSVVVDEAG